MKRRLLRGLDLGSLVAGLKALLLGGGAAAKVAAAVAIVSATTVVAADPVVQHQHRSHGSQPTRTIVPAQRLQTTRFETGTFAVPAAPSAARVLVLHAKRAKHQVASSGHRSTPALPEVSSPASKRSPHAKSPTAATPAANGHAKSTGAVSTTSGPKAKAMHPVSSRTHATRVPQRHSSPKVSPTPKSAAQAAAPQPSAAPPSSAPRGAHSGDAAGKTNDPTG
jgi:hypothetical protein